VPVVVVVEFLGPLTWPAVRAGGSVMGFSGDLATR
jgi:hypothetical protein